MLAALSGFALSPDAQSPETRRERFGQLLVWLSQTPFTVADYQRAAHQLAELARQTDHGTVLAEALIRRLRRQRIVLQARDVIERICSEVLARNTRGSMRC